LRKRVVPVIDPSIGKDQARITVTLRNGDRPSMFVEHAVGSVENPMSDRMIEDKFRGQAEGILAADRARAITDLCWRADELADAGEIARNGGRG